MSKRITKKKAKIWTYLVLYHNPDVEGAPERHVNAVYDYAESQLEKMNLPDGWREQGGYEQFTKWFNEKFGIIEL